MHVCIDGETISASHFLRCLPCTVSLKIFRKEHFFRGSDNDDQLLKIMKILGTDQFDLYLKTYGIHFETDLEILLRK
jgi:casein kinase II subunit alpha